MALALATGSPAAAEKRTTRGTGADGGHGNGRRNHNVFSTRSPTLNSGYQHTSTTTAGGATSVQNALCRHVTVCNITLQVTPRRSSGSAPRKAGVARHRDVTAQQNVVSSPPAAPAQLATPEQPAVDAACRNTGSSTPATPEQPAVDAACRNTGSSTPATPEQPVTGALVHLAATGLAVLTPVSAVAGSVGLG